MPIILNKLNQFGQLNSSDKSKNYKTVFLLGPPRSNSTHIHRLMSLHTEVLSPPLKELVFPGKKGFVMRAVLSGIPQKLINQIYNPFIHKTGANEAEADDIALLAAFSEGVFAWVYGDALQGAKKPTLKPEKHLPYLDSLHAYIAKKNDDKTIFAKYFAGVHHFADLQSYFPNARYILLTRDPEKVCYSLSTLIETALVARRIKLKNPEEYWNNIYQFMVDTYQEIHQVANIEDDRLLIISDNEVKNNLDSVVSKICVHSNLNTNRNDELVTKVNQLASRGTYQKRYEYSKVMKQFFSKNDFSDYYNSIDDTNHNNEN